MVSGVKLAAFQRRASPSLAALTAVSRRVLSSLFRLGMGVTGPSYRRSANSANTAGKPIAPPTSGSNRCSELIPTSGWSAGASANCTATRYGAAQIANVLKTAGGFTAAGNDLFAECAGLGSFEGVLNNTNYSVGDPSTRFQTTSSPGLSAITINSSIPNVSLSNFASPLMQIGDFDFKVVDGAIQSYRAGGYKTDAVRLISNQADASYDLFTMVPRTSTRGTVVYLGGHDYSGADGRFEVAGSRMVLNTLFNLGASCQETGVACNTGLLGECAQGVMSCDSQGRPYCKQIRLPQNETCDGKDNNCNGLVDATDLVFVSSADAGSDTLFAHAFDRRTGAERWRKTMGTGIRRERLSNYASPSAVTDGRLVVFFYGNGKTATYRRKKTKGLRRRRNEKHQAQPQEEAGQGHQHRDFRFHGYFLHTRSHCS